MQCPFCLRSLPWNFSPIPIVLPCCGQYSCEPCGKPLLAKVPWTCLSCFKIQQTTLSQPQYTARLKLRATANQINCFRSQIVLGLLAPSSDEAIHWWLHAESGALKAEMSLPPVIQYKLGNAWESGTLSQRGKDSLVEAVKYYDRSAGQGYDLAMFKMGMMYEAGRGVTNSHAAASGWYGKAAIKGNVDAMRRLGIVMLSGLGQAEPNPETAVRWWREASERNDIKSMVLLGKQLSLGIGAMKSDKKAVTLWNRAALAGDPEGMFLLGEAHHHGRGVPKRNIQQAVHWLKKSALNGYFAAQGMLKALGVVSIEGGIMRYMQRSTTCAYCEKGENDFEDVMIMCRRCCAVGYCSELCKHTHFRERHQKECGTLKPFEEVEETSTEEAAWDQYMTPAGDWYWYNSRTAETCWTKPEKK